MEKFCARCDEVKDASNFNRNSRRKDGLQTYCRACEQVARVASRERDRARSRQYYADHRADVRSKQAEYRAANKERLNAGRRADRAQNRDVYIEQQRATYARNKDRILAQQALYREANKDAKAARDRAWRLANVDRCRERARTYRINNRDVVRAAARRYVRNHPEKVNLHTQRRRARRKGLPTVGVTPELVALRMAMFGHRCWMCGGQFEHVDHVKPLAKGGPHMLANLRPACRGCNQSKNANWSGPMAAHAMRYRSTA